MTPRCIVIAASTLPRWHRDAVPDFVLQQAHAFKAIDPNLDIHILAPHHEGAAYREGWDGVTIHRFSYFWPASNQKLVYPAILPNLKLSPSLYLQVVPLLVAEFLALMRLCRRVKPELLYAHWFMPQAVVGGLVSRLLGIPLVFTSHSSDVRVMSLVPWFGRRITQATFRRAVAFTAVSRRVSARMMSFFSAEEWGQLQRKLRVIPMGVNLSEIHPTSVERRAELREKLGFSKCTAVLSMGRLTEKKGLKTLIQSFSLLRHHPHIVLIIAGSGEMEDDLREQIKQENLEQQVRMVGYVVDDEKLGFLQASDMAVFPSIETADGDVEGLPVTLMESLAAGLPCIASVQSGGEEVIKDEENGFLVPAADPQALADTILKVVGLDAPQQDRIRRNARDAASAFDWTYIANKHMAHLFSVTSEADHVQ